MIPRSVIHGWILLLVLASAGFQGCRREFEGEDVRTPPLQLRASVPADSIVIATGVTDITFQFNRATNADDLSVRLFPPPRSSGELRSVGTGRSATWYDVEIDAGDAQWHRLLLDAPDFLGPVMLQWMGGARRRGAISGCVKLLHPFLEPERAIVYAVPLAEGEPMSLEQMFERPPETVTLVRALRICRDGFYYRLSGLREGEGYAVYVILDSSGDGAYDPSDDWWGFLHAPGSLIPGRIVAGCTIIEVIAGVCSEAELTAMRLELLEPGTIPVGAAAAAARGRF